MPAVGSLRSFVSRSCRLTAYESARLQRRILFATTDVRVWVPEAGDVGMEAAHGAPDAEGDDRLVRTINVREVGWGGVGLYVHRARYCLAVAASQEGGRGLGFRVLDLEAAPDEEARVNMLRAANKTG
jgi:hypothetical protein